jgi:hypothetical protein
MSAHCNCAQCRDLGDDDEIPHTLPGFKVADLLADDEAVDVLSRKSAADRWTFHDVVTEFAIGLPTWGNA